MGGTEAARGERVGGKMLHLSELVPNGRVSTGLLGTYQGKLVWAVSREAYWRKTEAGTVMGLVGIGGGQEQGESLLDTVAREAMEETCTRVRITGAERTVWAYGDGTAKVVDLKVDEPAPVLIWQAPLNYLDSTGSWRVIDYICAVYRGEFLERPQPAAEVVGLVFCEVANFRAMLEKPVSLKTVLARGGDYVGRDLPGDTLFELHGSALYLARHWDLLEQDREYRTTITSL